MKRLVLGATLIVAALLWSAVPASAAEYDAYVGCGTTPSTLPSESCVFGSPVGLFFKSDEKTEYEVCVEYPDGFEGCAEEKEALAGVLYIDEFEPDELGIYFVSWYVGPEEVGFAAFNVAAPAPPVPTPPTPTPPAPTPPAPAPPAPAPAPAPAPPTKSVACLKAEIRVKQFRDLLRKTPPGKPKARNRDRLKAARATAKKLC